MDPAKMSVAIARHNLMKHDGLGEPSFLGDCCREFDNLFELLDCPEEMQVDQTAHYLKGKVGLWWNRGKSVIKEAWKESDEPFVSWKGFKDTLRGTFVPEHVRSSMRSEFEAFKLTEEMMIEHYHNRFMELAEYVSDLNYGEEVLAFRFGHKIVECRTTVRRNNMNEGFSGENSNGFRTPVPSYGSNRFNGSWNNQRSYNNNNNFQNRFNNNQGNGNGGNQNGTVKQGTTSASTVQGGVKNSGKLFMIGKEAAEGYTHVVSGTFLTNSKPSYVLFDSGETHSFISSDHVKVLGLVDPVVIKDEVTIPSGELITCTNAYKNVNILIGEVLFSMDLIEFPLGGFEIIFGMDWLSRNRAFIDCHQKKVSLKGTKEVRVSYRGFVVRPKVRLISTITLKSCFEDRRIVDTIATRNNRCNNG
ncbi:uncharacterized protein LOC141589803 [Silene latifolia]|uniref:uncharacterized protein LOC141589803 n=1 Tax=Silene latifolia TaxID=37657 RepID=UPI003D7794BF